MSRSKPVSGELLVAIVATAARDAGMIVVRRSPHKRSIYLRALGYPFKLRISDHQYSKASQQRNVDVILNYVLREPMMGKDAIVKGAELAAAYRQKCQQRLDEAHGDLGTVWGLPPQPLRDEVAKL